MAGNRDDRSPVGSRPFPNNYIWATWFDSYIMPAGTPDEQSYWSAVQPFRSVRQGWNRIDRGWQAIAVGAVFLLLALVHVHIPW